MNKLNAIKFYEEDEDHNGLPYTFEDRLGWYNKEEVVGYLEEAIRSDIDDWESNIDDIINKIDDMVVEMEVNYEQK